MRLLLAAGLLGLAVVSYLVFASRESQGSSQAAAKGKKILSYEKDIEPILAKHCQVCHGGQLDKKGDFDVTTYETFMKGGQGGKSVAPGKSAQSLIVRMMLGQQKPYMPPPSEEWVPIEEILLIKQWIDQGAKGPNKKTK